MSFKSPLCSECPHIQQPEKGCALGMPVRVLRLNCEQRAVLRLFQLQLAASHNTQMRGHRTALLTREQRSGHWELQESLEQLWHPTLCTVCDAELFDSPGEHCNISCVTPLCESVPRNKKAANKQTTKTKTQTSQRKQEKDGAVIHVPVTVPRTAAMTRGIFNRQYHVSRPGCF